MSDQGGGDEASWDEIALEAFEDKFKPEDFARVAEALGLPPELETLAWLRDLPKWAIDGPPAMGE